MPASRKRLPALRASALYLPMVEAMKSGKSHPYTIAGDGGDAQGRVAIPVLMVKQ